MIFNVSTLDNQIAQLKAERDRKDQLNNAATQVLSDLADLLDELDEDAIAKLKSEVLALFPAEETQPNLEDIQTQPDVEPEETISSRVRQTKGDYYRLVQSENPAIAYFKRRDSQLGCCYIGSMSQSRLQVWADWLLENGYVTKPVAPRPAKRLTNWGYELKLAPMSLPYLDDLTGLDYTRYPSSYSPVLAA